MSNGVACLDHHDAENVLVCVCEIVEARVVVSSDRPVAACAQRRVSACLNGALRIGRAVDHWDDHTPRARVERLADDPGLVPGDADEWRYVGRRNCLQHRDHLRVVDNPVLHVEQIQSNFVCATISAEKALGIINHAPSAGRPAAQASRSPFARIRCLARVFVEEVIVTVRTLFDHFVRSGTATTSERLTAEPDIKSSGTVPALPMVVGEVAEGAAPAEEAN